MHFDQKWIKNHTIRAVIAKDRDAVKNTANAMKLALPVMVFVNVLAVVIIRTVKDQRLI